MPIPLFKSIVALIAFSSLALSSGTAQAGRLFFSSSATSPTDVFVTETNPTVSLNVGQSTTVYIWFERYGLGNSSRNTDTLDGLALDVASSNPIVQRIDFEIDDPLDEVVTEETRWGAWGPGLVPNTTLLVNDSNAVKVGGSFFGKSNDPGRDPVTSAVPKPSDPLGGNGGVARYAVLTLNALSPGTTQIRFQVGNAGISYINRTNPTHAIHFGWGDAAVLGTNLNAASALADMTINVVPEPSALVLLGLGVLGLVAVRRAA